MAKRFSSDYDPTQYVNRPPLEDILIKDFLLKVPSRIKDQRSYIIQCPAKSGKSWLLECIVEHCEKSPLRPIILTVCIDDFTTTNYSVAEDLCVPIVQRLWDTVDHMYPHVAPDLKFSGKTNEIIHYLSLLGVRLFSQPLQPLVLIFVDGIEEIIEASVEKKNLLAVFEDTVIAPLFKHYNVRILGAHRGRSAHWHSYLLKKSTSVKPLPDFFVQDASNPGSNSPLRQFLLFFGTNPPFQFDTLRQQLPYYAWNHPGTNNLLFKHASLHGPVFTQAILESAMEQMTRSARGRQLNSTYRDWLERVLLNCQPTLSAPLTDVIQRELAMLNHLLGIEEGPRNDFLNELQTRGVGTIKFPYFDIRPEVAAIFFELQRRKTP